MARITECRECGTKNNREVNPLTCYECGARLQDRQGVRER